MCDIKLSLSEFPGENTVLSHPFGRKSPVRKSRHPIERESGKRAPRKGFLKNSQDEDFHSDSSVTDVASRLFFSQIYISVSFLKCLCPKNFRQKPQSCSAYLQMLLLHIFEKREISTTDSFSWTVPWVLWEWSGDLITITPPSEGHRVSKWGSRRPLLIHDTILSFRAASVLDCDTSTSCSCMRGMKKRLVLDVNYWSLTGTFCAEVWTGAQGGISVWQAALELLCCTPALCQSHQKTFHVPLRENSEL